MISASLSMRTVALIGDRAGSSLSPPMQNSAFRARGVPAHYVPLTLQPADLATVIEAMRRLDFLGANVTVPYKELVIPLLDELSPEAVECGSVNTIRNDGGKLTGFSTDGEGFLRACRYRGFAPAGRGALLIGAGGAGRAVAFALAGTGIARLLVANRTRSRAEDLGERMRKLHPGLPVEVMAPDDLRPEMVRSLSLVVNATTIGSSPGDSSPLPPGSLGPGQAVWDLVYAPPTTTLLEAARAAGAQAENGLAMLLFQGEEAFRVWTGLDPPHREMAQALATAAGLPAEYFSIS